MQHRCRAHLAHTRQSWPDSGIVCQVKGLLSFQLVPPRSQVAALTTKSTARQVVVRILAVDSDDASWGNQQRWAGCVTPKEVDGIREQVARLSSSCHALGCCVQIRQLWGGKSPAPRKHPARNGRDSRNGPCTCTLTTKPSPSTPHP